MTRLSVSAARAATIFPVAVDPVNAILSMPGMLDHPRAESRVLEPGNDVEHAFGYAGLERDLPSSSAVSGVTARV